MTYDVVIPCRNEARTIPYIVSTFTHHPLIRNVLVVVDSDTTDDTREKAEHYGGCVIKGGRGKGQNVKIGLDYVETEKIILCDGDIEGFTHQHIDVLTRGLSPFVIGVPDFPLIEVLNSPRVTMEWMPRIFSAYPWVSGIRVVITGVVRGLDLHGYLMEVQINRAHEAIGITPDFRFLAGVHSPFKMDDKRMQEMERDRTWGKKHGIFSD